MTDDERGTRKTDPAPPMTAEEMLAQKLDNIQDGIDELRKSTAHLQTMALEHEQMKRDIAELQDWRRRVERKGA